MRKRRFVPSTAVGAGVAAALACTSADRPVTCAPAPGADSLLTPARVVLVGEIHGTREAPDAFGRLVCLAVAKGVPVTVGLEITIVDEPAFDAFMESTGADADVAALLASPFWHREFQDGRSGVAMLDLVIALRALAGRGDLRLVLIDDPQHPDGRDAAMAERLAEAARDTTRLTLALTGNLHNRMSPDAQWMGRRLADRIAADRIRSLNLRYAPGSAWVCMQDGCRERTMRGIGAAVDAPTVVLGEDVANEHYHGVLDVGPITASPPAVDARAAAQPMRAL